MSNKRFNTHCNNLSMTFIMLTHLLSIQIISKIDNFKKLIIIIYIFSDYFFHKNYWYNNYYFIKIHFAIIAFLILNSLYRSIQLANKNNYIGLFLLTTYLLHNIILRMNSKYACYIESTIHINQWLSLKYLILNLKSKNIKF